MPTTQPSVSALISTYNARHLIRGCIENLLRQTIAPELEIIVVDSCSETNEYEIAVELQALHPRLHCLRTARRENSHAALNRAIQMAHGRYLIAANTDDRHRHDALEKMACALDAAPDVALVYADALRTSTLNETFEQAMVCGRPVVRWPEYQPYRIFGDARIGAQPMWRRSLHDQIGLFDDSLTYVGDLDLWLRIAALTTFRFHHIDEVLGLWYDVPTTMSQANPELMRAEMIGVRQRYHDLLVASGKLPSIGSPLDQELDAARDILAGRTIALFGAGERGDRILDALRSRGQTVVAFLDNNPEKQGNIRCGLPVFAPEMAVPAHIANFILVASMYWAEIAAQLQDLGLKPNEDYAVFYA
jgi:glycosyltransferase involved in cell wall biosynthesis